ncbi:hypothetical protein NM208_g10444 [Fusarium decemcellulare]|uniref:Uncharacterized protein n=1 Tax=Fusarium decemcellulare TaxID=57161 RepID=A0ACC1RY30_9HYPO|nr:hypothetical protein NM208_g10444 [Fusarium decemcellulare]
MSAYIIKNATVISVDDSIGNIDNCDILIDNSIISAVGPNLQYSSRHTVIDGTNCIVSPGFVDTHRHTWQTQLRALTTDFVLTDYLLALRLIYGSCYTSDDVYIGNYCGALESIDNGTTYLIDHSHIINSPEHADAAIQALRDARIRATFCYGLYANPYWEGMPDAFERHFFSSNEPQDLVRFGFSPSEPEVVPFDRFAQEIEFGRSLGAAVITAHNNSQGKFNCHNALIRKLDQRGLLGPDLLLSHSSNIYGDELAAAKRHRVALSSTPDTELQMGMGHPIAFQAKDIGCTASLGVDICSNSPGDMFQQMRLLLQLQRHVEHEKSSRAPVETSRKCIEVLEMATMGGAKAVGLENIIGSITPGKRADLLITKCESTRLVPVHDAVGALVLYANGSDIDTVFINGEIVKSGGKLVNVDWPEVKQRLRESVTSIMKTSAAAPRHKLEEMRNTMAATLFDKGTERKAIGENL